jgi:hypothetical protein
LHFGQCHVGIARIAEPETFRCGGFFFAAAALDKSRCGHSAVIELMQNGNVGHKIFHGFSVVFGLTSMSKETGFTQGKVPVLRAEMLAGAASMECRRAIF